MATVTIEFSESVLDVYGVDLISHSDEAYEWYEDSAKTKAYFVKYCLDHGVDIRESEGWLYDNWADVAMGLFDIHGE